jgi:para-aminobenzoate synthetase component 1
MPTRAIRLRWREPAAVLQAFADEPWAVGLISGGEQAHWSYVARRPDRTLSVPPDDHRDPLASLASLLAEAPRPVAGGPPFQGGLIGLASYELADRFDPLGLARRAGWPDLACARYPNVLAFDHGERALIAVGSEPEAAVRWLDERACEPVVGSLAEAVFCDPPDDYERAVAEVVLRIADGEIFQANVARRWRGRLAPGARPFDLALRLSRSSPAPFSAYLRLKDAAVVSNSPERFVLLTSGQGRLQALTQPIKGTRPRSSDRAEDAALAAELGASTKDRAENLMIVDLMRNDLARVCTPGAVETPRLCQVQSFANVHHLVSAVTGTLQPGKGPKDLLRAAFPPGSITGAPKHQAMKVIAGLEAPRGPFFGSMFWIGADGAMDSSVLIRTVLFERAGGGWTFEARAGAGLVADSDPHAERLETEAKVSAVLAALAAET